MALALGVGAVAFAALSISGFLRQFDSFGLIWSVGAATGIFGPLVVGATLSWWLPVRAVRALAGVTAVSHLVALATVPLALPEGHLGGALGSPWVLGISVLGTAAAAVAWRPAITWPYLVACSVLIGLDRFAVSELPIPDLAIQDGLHSLLFDAIFTSLALSIRRAGRTLDAASSQAVEATRSLASNDARVRERGRIEALLHDSVLVALLASARSSPRAAPEARAALDRLGDLAAPEHPVEQYDTRTWLWRLQALTTELAPNARFSHDAHGEGASTDVPANVGDAVLEATAEALRNSVQYAGDAARAVHVKHGAAGLEVTVLDDGRGFDPQQVAESRLGVAVSIRQRMLDTPGGRAIVVSQPGVGTRVAIGWAAQ
jgi:signal transduction histidine kinase